MRQLLVFAFIGLSAVAFGQNKTYQISDPEKLPQSINSVGEEGLPILAPDGKTLYFVRTFYDGNTGGANGGQDVWYSTKKNGKWTDASNDLSTFNNEANNAVTGISHDGNILYLHGTYIEKEELELGLSYSKKEGDKWTAPSYLHVPKLAIKSDHYSFFLDPHGRYMIISAHGKGAIGEEDLYLCVRGEKGRWDAPIHLGPIVNSTGYEISPFLDDNGKTLYFASNGHGGEGDADIFVTHRLDESWTNWSPPRNLGPKVNSSGFDAYFSVNENGTVFFASNRDGDFCDIYEARFQNYTREPVNKSKAIPDDMPKDELISIGGIFEYNELPASNVKLQLVNEDNTFVRIVETDENGKFNFEALPPGENYMVKLLEDDVDMKEKSRLFVMNKEGGKILVKNFGDGVFPLSPKEEKAVAVRTVKPIERTEPAKETVQGYFEYNALPAANSLLEMVDENGEVVGIIETDADGLFEYEKLALEKKYILRLAESDEKVMDDAKIFLMDSNGEKELAAENTEKGFQFKKLTEDEYANVSKMRGEDAELVISDATNQERVVVSGIFDSNEMPDSGVKMNLSNEEEVVIRVTQTDDKGTFSFKNLAAHKDYIVDIVETDGTIPEDAKLYLVDDEGNKVLLADKLANGKYKFKAYSAKDLKNLPKLVEEEIAVLPEEKIKVAAVPEPQPKEKPSPAPEAIAPKPAPAPEPMSPITGSVLFQYGWNIWDLSESDKKKLDEEIIPRMEKDPSLVLEVEGHADSKGSASNNMKVSKNRALDVRQYLMSRLVDGDRIKTAHYGEDKPKVSNNSDAGRAENRRVEIRFKPKEVL